MKIRVYLPEVRRLDIASSEPAFREVRSPRSSGTANLASMLRLNLFTYRDLRKWLDDPFQTPPLLPESEQLTLALA